MPLPRVAIVGRPNVGKSSLVNMLAGAKVSIVDPTPGVTRDRVTTIVELPHADPNRPTRLVEFTDTGGYGVYTAEGGRFDDAGEDLARLTGDIERQIATAVERADFILFVVDAQDGVTALDQTVAQLLRRQSFRGQGRAPAPVRVVANKVDATNWEAFALDGASLGFGEPLMVSAKTNFRRRQFVEALYDLVPDTDDRSRAEAFPEMKIAIVGRRNAGKSSFVNALAGEERCIVSEIAGTTRDAVDVRFEVDGKSFVAIDTAGLRKRTRLADAVEYYAYHRALTASDRSDVCLMLIDATRPVTGVDKRLGAHIRDHFRPCVIVVTKWDLAEGRKNRKGQIVSTDDYAEYLGKELPGMSLSPIVFTSSVRNEGLREAVEMAHELHRQSLQRVPTAKLNEVIREIMTQRGPSGSFGIRAKVLYVAQVAVGPPTIVMVVNKREAFTRQYERYLLNRLHEELPFPEVPIRLLLRERTRVPVEELKPGVQPRDASGARLVPAFDPREVARYSDGPEEEEMDTSFIESPEGFEDGDDEED